MTLFPNTEADVGPADGVCNPQQGLGRARQVNVKGIRAEFVREYEKVPRPQGGWSWRSNAVELADKYRSSRAYVLAVMRGEKRSTKWEK